MKLVLKDESETMAIGASLFESIHQNGVIFLVGDLGAGKTTLVRGFLRAAGYDGIVKSPTYTLMEEYTLNDTRVLHLDLYRLADPEELEWMGIRDYLCDDVIYFIEWPKFVGAFLPQPDIQFTLEHKSHYRALIVSALTNKGKQIEERLKLVLRQHRIDGSTLSR